MAAIEPINCNNPIKVFPSGPMWVAMVGDELISADAGFDRSPIKALETLLAIEGVLEATPHATYQITCEKCGHFEVSVAPYPVDSDSLECSNCGHMNPIEQDLI